MCSYIEDSLEQVLNVTADSPQACHLFSGSKPHVHSYPLLPYSGQLQVHVLEGLGEGSAWPSDRHRATLAFHCHCRSRTRLTNNIPYIKFLLHTYSSLKSLTFVRDGDDTRPKYRLHGETLVDGGSTNRHTPQNTA